MSNNQDKWDEAYRNADIESALPSQVLSENGYLLPDGGDALDVACGRAGNALFLENNGFVVDAVDSSAVVLGSLKNYIDAHDLNIQCLLKDLENPQREKPLFDKKYDVIVISYYLHRDLFPEIINALKPNGLLFYQTWSQLKCTDAGPSNPKFRFQSGELLLSFHLLKTISYRENGLLGDCNQGLRNEVQLVAQKESG